MKILYGTGNKAKVEAMKKIIRIHNFDVELMTIKDINFNQEIVEDGETFEENSEIKARAIKKYCDENGMDDLIILADDAGICVDALNGEPGVYTGRYAGEHPTQMENLTKLLNNMKEYKTQEERAASFVCVLTAILPNAEKVVARGECRGSIALECGTLGGLTYGPVFVPNGFNKSMNDMNEEEYADVHNHRDIAMEAIFRELTKLGY